MTNSNVSDPVLSPDLLERVLAKLGLSDHPSLDRDGLNGLYVAFCGKVPALDNILKRIWLTGDQTAPLTGGNPADYFENWLTHGTGGTCWPTNGAVYALVSSLGFDARRIAGCIVMQEYPGTNHGSVVVTLDGVDYVVDGNLGAFEVLPLMPGRTTSTGQGLNQIKAVPVENGFEVIWYSSVNRDEPLTFRTEPEHDPVDHNFFLTYYDETKKISIFNDTLFIVRRYPDSIVTLGREKAAVAADNTLTKTAISDAERQRVLIEEFGISEEIAAALPPDVPGGFAML
jgi:arylamine N-acetyltransferase